MRKSFASIFTGVCAAFFAALLFTGCERLPKTAVVYFSVTEKTENLAKGTASALKADCIEILPAQPYAPEDLSQRNPQSRAILEAADENSRPALLNPVDLSPYEVIILFYPIWRGIAPRLMYTLEDSQNWEGKKLLTLCTSGGSGLGDSGNDLARHAPGADYRGGADFSKASVREIKRFVVQSLK